MSILAEANASNQEHQPTLGQTHLLREHDLKTPLTLDRTENLVVASQLRLDGEIAIRSWIINKCVTLSHEFVLILIVPKYQCDLEVEETVGRSLAIRKRASAPCTALAH